MWKDLYNAKWRGYGALTPAGISCLEEDLEAAEVLQGESPHPHKPHHTIGQLLATIHQMRKVIRFWDDLGVKIRLVGPDDLEENWPWICQELRRGQTLSDPALDPDDRSCITCTNFKRNCDSPHCSLGYANIIECQEKGTDEWICSKTGRRE